MNVCIAAEYSSHKNSIRIFSRAERLSDLSEYLVDIFFVFLVLKTRGNKIEATFLFRQSVNHFCFACWKILKCLV